MANKWVYWVDEHDDKTIDLTPKKFWEKNHYLHDGPQQKIADILYDEFGLIRCTDSMYEPLSTTTMEAVLAALAADDRFELIVPDWH